MFAKKAHMTTKLHCSRSRLVGDERFGEELTRRVPIGVVQASVAGFRGPELSTNEELS